MDILDLLRVVIIISIFLVAAGGSMMVDSLWGVKVVNPMKASGAIGFMFFELAMAFVCAGLIVGVIVQVLKGLFGNIFSIGTFMPGLNFAASGLSLFALIATIILTVILINFIDFIIWHMPFIVMALAVIFVIVGWIKQELFSAIA